MSEAAQGSHKNPRRIVQVHCGPRVQTLFVVIPGVGTLGPESWDDSKGSTWLRSIRPPSAPDIGIFAFENGLGSDEALSWRQIENAGADFLGSLLDLSQEDMLLDCPIVLLSHSLGGLILKRAMCLAHQQPARFRNLFRNIAGSILLACPHSRSADIDVWQNIPSILKKYSKTKTKTKNLVNKEMARALAEDSLSFERAYEQIPVLSLYETLETRTTGLFFGKTMLVGEGRSRMNTPRETTLAVSADHNAICCLRDGSSELARVVSFIDIATAKARENIEKGSQEYKIPPALDQSTLRTRTSVGSIRGQTAEKDLTVAQTSLLLTPSNDSTGKRAVVGSSPTASFEALADFSIAKTDPHLPCHIVPFNRNRVFFGRESILEQIEEVLCPEAPSENGFNGASYLRTFVICGPGGIGKTQIASEIAYRCRNRFDAIFWIHADELSKLDREFNNVAVTLGLVAKDSAESRDYLHTRDLVLGWLAKPLKSYKQLENQKSEEGTWLLVFDNVDDQDTLDNFWPKESTGSILITSRDPMVKTSYYSQGSSITLPPFNDDEAMAFLLKLTGREKEREERDCVPELVRVLGGYPLAICHIAPVILRNDYSFSEFLNKYEKESYHTELFKLQIRTPTTHAGYPFSLATVFALDNLKKSRLLLDALSMLDPDGIPEYVVEANDAVASWQGYPNGSEAYEEARAELLQSSLIARDRSAKKLVLHRLIQDVTRSKMTDEHFNDVFSAVICFISAVWPYEEFGFGNETYRWGRCSELYPHLLRMHKLSTRFKLPAELSATTIEGPRLFLEGAWFAIMISRFADAYTLLDLAQRLGTNLQEGSENGQGDDNPVLRDQLDSLVRTSYHHRGVVALHANQPSLSLSNHKKFTQMVRDKFGDNPRGKDQSLGVAWNELGNAYLQNKEWAEGIKCFEKSIFALQNLDSATEISVSMPLINLAFGFWLEGRLEEAASTFQRALSDREREYGVDDKTSFVTGKLLLGYGNVQASRGLLDKSFELHQRCLRQYRATVGDNHHRTADACVKVADHFIRIGQYESALSLLSQAYKVFGVREYFAPEKARVCYKRGRLFEVLGRFDEARADSTEALALYQSIRLRDSTPLAQLTDKDFDDNIMFWSK